MEYMRGAVGAVRGVPGAVRGVSGAAILQFVVDGVKCEDEGQMFMVPWHAVSEWAACLDLDGYMEGKVMVVLQVTGPVEHMGLEVVVEQYIHLRDPFVSTELGERSVQICPPGVIEGAAGDIKAFPFRIKLDGGEGPSDARKNLWLEGYNGQAFALRHTLRASLLRPWYAANCNVHVPLSLYRIPLSGYDMPEVHEPERIFVDVGDGKSVRRNYLELDSKWVPCDGPLRVKVFLSDLTTSIDCGRMLLIRAEFVGHVCASEEVVLGHTFFGAPSVVGGAGGEDEVEEDPVTAAERLGEGAGAASGSSSGAFGGPWFGSGDAALNADYPRTRGFASRRDQEEGAHDDENIPFAQPVLKGTSIVADIPLGPKPNSALGMAEDLTSTRCLLNMDLEPSFSSKEALQQRSTKGAREHFSARQQQQQQREGKGAVEGKGAADADSAACMDRGDSGGSGTGTVGSGAVSDVSQGQGQGQETSGWVEDMLNEAAPLDDEEQVAVRYFLRFVVQDAHSDSFWNTHEIKLYRSSRPAAMTEAESARGQAV